MRRQLRRLGVGIGLWACGLWVGLPLVAQSTASPSYARPATDGRTVSGIVVSAKTGQPLPQVEVTLHPVNSQERTPIAQDTTDDQGRFSLPNVPNGKFSLFATRHGYVPSFYGEHPGGLSTAIVTGEGLPTTGLRIALRQFGSIYGAISDDSGDPVPRAQIQLFRQNPNDSGKIVRAGGTLADPQGNYELSKLQPGTYFLCATGVPWYTTRGRFTNAQGAQRSPLDVAYPMTCHPGVTDPSQAEAISVGPGEHVPISISMHAVPSVHFSLPMSRGADGHSFSVPQLTRQVFGVQEFIQPGMGYMTGGGNGEGPTTMEFSAAPGQYLVQVRNERGDVTRYGTIDATSDGAGLDMSATSPAAAVTGKVVTSTGEALPPRFYLLLSSVQTEENTAARLEPDGTLKVDALPPGEYNIITGSARPSVYIRQMTVNGTPVAGRALKVGSDPITLNLTLAPAIATVSGYAARNGEHASGIFLALVPRQRSGKPVINQSDSDGSFEFPETAPGDYTLVAVEDGWTLDWAHRETFAPYLAKGVHVVIQAGAREIAVKDAVEVQPK